MLIGSLLARRAEFLELYLDFLYLYSAVSRLGLHAPPSRWCYAQLVSTTASLGFPLVPVSRRAL